MCTQTQTSFDASSDAASSSQHETVGSLDGSPACHCAREAEKVSGCCEEVVAAVARVDVAPRARAASRASLEKPDH